MEPTLSAYIQKVFDSWTVLRIAAQQGTGGKDTTEKIRGLPRHILQRLSRQTQSDDIAEWLDEYLCRVLNVLCEDESQFTVASLIHEAYMLHLAGKTTEIAELSAKIPAGCDLSKCHSQVINNEAEALDASCEESETSYSGDDTEETSENSVEEMDTI